MIYLLLPAALFAILLIRAIGYFIADMVIARRDRKERDASEFLDTILSFKK